MASNHAPTGDAKTVARSRETLWAIIGSFVLSLVLASAMTGNPFRALSDAYKDYSSAPAAPAAPAAPK